MTTTPDSTDLLLDVIRHVLAMADDAYLTKHPEWQEIVFESQRALCQYDRE